MGFSGFSVMALDCLLIETLQQFKKGESDTPRGCGEKYYVEFLTDTSFNEYFSEDMAKKFYKHIRNGILHQTEN